MSLKIGTILSSLYESIAISEAPFCSRIALQYLFDIRVLYLMLSCDSLRILLPSFEKKLDPFDFSLLSSPVMRNARIAAQRYSVLFGYILSDFVPNKELSLSPSYSAVVDISPRIMDIARFSLLPRLSKTSKNLSFKMECLDSSSSLNRKNEIGNSPSVRNSSSLSSFYKIPSWFGS
ncbi:unnamed protein product [Dracunculus medinensis]|uniref:Uncharacterized protein n=1 Tax=Dracunculus medinensis TaxID=318479 RepID=A0A0N4UEI1_DRAME|nr:unnamed protein product [Dracunculus medinensis]